MSTTQVVTAGLGILGAISAVLATVEVTKRLFDQAMDRIVPMVEQRLTAIQLEFARNGGSSMRDLQDRIEANVTGLHGKVDDVSRDVQAASLSLVALATKLEGLHDKVKDLEHRAERLEANHGNGQ